MAARRHQKLLEKAYRLLADDLRRAPPAPAEEEEELQEADVWGGLEADRSEAAREGEVDAAPARPRRGRGRAAAAARSVPVDVPGWGRKVGPWAEDEEESDGEGEVVPPHVYLWRRRREAEDAAAAYSLEEGWGRTLKGRDLSRVRDAVWEKIGFLD